MALASRWPGLRPGAVLEDLVAGDPDVRRRRGLDVHERGALAGGQRRQPAREHVAVARLVDPPHLAVEPGDADVELVDRLGGPVGHRHRVPVVRLAPLRPRRRRVLLDLDGRGVFSSCQMLTCSVSASIDQQVENVERLSDWLPKDGGGREVWLSLLRDDAETSASKENQIGKKLRMPTWQHGDQH